MTEGISLCVLAAGVAAALLAGIAKTGIPGIGILAVPLLVMVFPAKQAVGVLLPILIGADLCALIYYRRHADWKKLFELFPCVAAGILLGALVLWKIDSAGLKPLLGALVLALLVLELARRRFGWKNMPHHPAFIIGVGTLAGFATTVGNVAGPIMNIYLISKGLEKHSFMGTAAWYFFIFNCVKVPIYLALGMINGQTLLFDLWMIPAIAGGALLGRWLIKRLSAERFKLLVLLLAALGGLKLLF